MQYWPKHIDLLPFLRKLSTLYIVNLRLLGIADSLSRRLDPLSRVPACLNATNAVPSGTKIHCIIVDGSSTY